MPLSTMHIVTKAANKLGFWLMISMTRFFHTHVIFQREKSLKNRNRTERGLKPATTLCLSQHLTDPFVRELPSCFRRGGCGIKKKPRSHLSAADGVVRNARCSVMADFISSRNIRIPRLPKYFVRS